MTESTWRTSSDLKELLDYLGGKTRRGEHPSFQKLLDDYGSRKVGLFAVACCRRLWDRLTGEHERAFVELAERQFEGLATEDEFNEAVYRDEAGGIVWGILLHAAEWVGSAETEAERHEELLGHLAQLQRDSGRTMFRERIAQAGLVREIFGNPFRRVELDPAWLTPTVLSLARSAYDDRRWEVLPVLADALEEIGCENRDILEHCRSNGEHSRGCWVIDLLLGKDRRME